MDYDEDYERPKKDYWAINDKDVFIHGKPGDEDFGVDKTPEGL